MECNEAGGDDIHIRYQDDDSSIYGYRDFEIKNNPTSLRLNNFNKDNEIAFAKHSHSYCICIISIVNSIQNTTDLRNSEKIRSYYSIFLNTMASIIKHHNGKVIKNVGEFLLYYFPKTVNLSKMSSFQDVLDCGLEMIEANPILNVDLSKKDLPGINYRISGNYGKVELATSSNSNNVDLFGPTVNICSKINHLALSNEMVISKDLYNVISRTSYFKDYYFKEIIESENNNNEYFTYLSHHHPVYSVHRINSPRQQIEIDNKKRLKYKEQNQNKQNQANSSFNILLIDDDKDILFTFTTIIEGEGYNATSISDPYKALNHFSQMDPYHYDLTVMDIRMPGINGIQLYSKIKVMNPDIKVLFLSALDAVDELLSIFPEIKSSEIIRKPIEPADLLSKVNSILRL